MRLVMTLDMTKDPGSRLYLYPSHGSELMLAPPLAGIWRPEQAEVLLLTDGGNDYCTWLQSGLSSGVTCGTNRYSLAQRNLGIRKRPLAT